MCVNLLLKKNLINDKLELKGQLRRAIALFKGETERIEQGSEQS
jgi:hypothetical protein